jgi:hypothetical protein
MIIPVLLNEGTDRARTSKKTRSAPGDRRIARTGHRLNPLAAVFLPVSTIGGLFGMNLHNGFENAGPALFWLVTLGVGVAGGVLLAWTRRE